MTHAEALLLIDAFVDDELDLRLSAEVDAHVAGCAECARERDAKLALRELVRAAALRPELPARFRPRPRRWRATAGAAVAVAACAALVLLLPRRSLEVDEVVAAHSRALMSGRHTEVTSTDQHTVKPWFQGKVPFGVPARDFAAEGFALLGGRLETLDGAPAAALVYRHGAHLIDLFVWPGSGPSRRLERRGYYLYFWSRDGLRYALAGDTADLEALVKLTGGD